MNYIERRQTSVSSRIIPVQPFDYVVFVATGDLTKRKLIPALYHRFLDGQFDECGLTLKEVSRIGESLVKSLTAVYHGRVKYPEQERATSSA